MENKAGMPISMYQRKGAESNSMHSTDHSKEKSGVLDWNERYKIIVGICKGLHHLHEGRGSAHILPLDLKPANVLLDNDMTPKIADFGQSRLFGEGQTHTANVVGTL